MLHNFSKVILGFGVLFYLGCVKVAKKNEQANQLGVPSDEILSEGQGATNNDLLNTSKNPKIIYETDTDRAQILWPSSWSEKIKVEVTDIKNNKSWTEILPVNEKWILPSSNQINQIEVFKLKVFNLDGLILSELIAANPISLKIEKNVSLKELLSTHEKIEKLYFNSLEVGADKTLFIEDFSGEIEIKNLISENGNIKTFQETQKSLWPNQARDVGQFKILIHEGLGQLKFVIQGENGADGLSGPEPTLEMKGKKGAPGQHAEFQNMGTPVCIGRGDFCDITSRFKCIKPGGMGGKGFKGQQGFPGKDGLSGGSVYPFSIENKSNQLKVSISKLPGNGGKGGLGGRGGEGGEPGDGSDGADADLLIFLNIKSAFLIGRVSDPCTKLGNYGPGDEGDVGPLGQNGQSGLIL